VSKITGFPRAAQAREAYALVIGKDGSTLLNAIYASSAPTWLRDIPAVQTLRRVWVQQFFWQEGELRWREITNILAAGDCINSPYEPEAQYARKARHWLGGVQSPSHRNL
jgi:transposase